MLKAEQAVKSELDDVLMQTEKYLKRQANNQLIFYFRNMALYHTGQLLDHLLDYPLNMGVKALYFPWNSDSRESEYGHFLYEDLGYINEAQRWEFEAMVVWGETAPHLLNLADTMWSTNVRKWRAASSTCSSSRFSIGKKLNNWKLLCIPERSWSAGTAG